MNTNSTNNIINTGINNEYKAFDLAEEYRGYTGYERYAIATDLPEEELRSKYGAELSEYEPFIIITLEMGLIMKEHNNNDEKFRKRESRGLWTLSIDEVEGVCRCEDSIATNNLEIRNDLIMQALDSLKGRLRSRIISKYFDGLTEEEIAKECGCTQQHVSKDIQTALKKLKETLVDMGVNA